MTNPELASMIWPLLRKLAADQQTMTYGELANLVKRPARFLSEPLTLIHNQCTQNGWPPINALIVNSETGLPGGGYPDGPLTEEQFAQICNQIYTHPW